MTRRTRHHTTWKNMKSTRGSQPFFFLPPPFFCPAFCPTRWLFLDVVLNRDPFFFFESLLLMRVRSRQPLPPSQCVALLPVARFLSQPTHGLSREYGCCRAQKPHSCCVANRLLKNQEGYRYGRYRTPCASPVRVGRPFRSVEHKQVLSSSGQCK